MIRVRDVIAGGEFTVAPTHDGEPMAYKGCGFSWAGAYSISTYRARTDPDVGARPLWRQIARELDRYYVEAADSGAAGPLPDTPGDVHLFSP